MGLFDSWSVKDFNIHLSSTTLLPGQMVSGNVVFTVTSETSFRKFTFKLIGREFTHVAITRSNGKSSHTSHYYGKRNFFKVHITPLGMPKWGGDWKGTLAPGTYNFPFAVRLPMDCLPTMSHSSGSNYGSVHYFVKAKIDIPSGPDSDKQVTFNVITPMPISQYQAAMPYNSQPTREARKCCCCCDRGYSTVSFAVEKTTIIFGKDTVLNGHITIDNSASKEAAKTIKVKLVHQTNFNASGYSRVAVTNLAEVSVDAGVEAHQQGEKTIPFQLSFDKLVGPDSTPLPCNFRGDIVTNIYLLSFSSGGDDLGRVELFAASSLDEGNQSYPVQTNSCRGQTVPKGQYPRFLYAPPPGGEPQVPPQSNNIGPFPCEPPLQPIPYQ